MVSFFERKGIIKEGANVSSITQCKKHLKKVYINIYDYVAMLEGRESEYGEAKFVCKNLKELRIRCGEAGFYPKKHAKAGTLKHLLKVLTKKKLPPN